MPNQLFSQRLDEWLKGSEPKTVQNLIDNFAEKSFAILFLVLMAIPALPLPTGGVTHIFEIVTMLLALELIAGRCSVWLPTRWRKLKLPKKLQSATLPALVKFIKKIERHSKPRLKTILKTSVFSRIAGLIIFILTIFAFFAPPFSGLDTLPSIGVVLTALAMILEDIVLYLLGTTIGLLGVGLVVAAGKIILKVV